MHQTLLEFQNSGGIPFEQQIILIDNENLFSGFDPVIFPYFLENRVAEHFWRFRRRIGNKQVTGNVVLPEHNNKLFLGFFDNSCDFPEEPLLKLFGLIEKVPNRIFSLVIGKGDYHLTEHFFSEMPDNLAVVLANNISFNHPQVQYLPIGRDFRNLDFLQNSRPETKKSTLCYCNYSLDTHEQRDDLYRILSGKEFINFEHMGEFLSYPISRKQFLDNLGGSKFSVCPRGNAIDTFRLWDSLYLGTIPITLKEANFQEELSDLPILFLESLTDFVNLTAEDLEGVYHEFLETEYNYEKLTMSYWWNKLSQYS